MKSQGSNIPKGRGVNHVFARSEPRWGVSNHVAVMHKMKARLSMPGLGPPNAEGGLETLSSVPFLQLTS